ncbi:addiction module antidote protein [Pandoraea sputorum]|uniref:addiction module antidote protein n=1 Tax=Pandoraea sputorum TaxID=93222 RepID=UPI002AF6B080|nr:addiction module antidote protein [Pandoraea sputorum]
MKNIGITRFDASEYLDNDETIAEYLNAALEENDAEFFLAAVADVAKAKGIAQVATAAGLGRESLYKTLSPDAQPRFFTILRVMHALGVTFSAIPKQANRR